MAAVFSLCAAYALYCLITNPAGPITTPDSIHYLNMTPIVPLGYPFFLTFTGARGAIIAQPIIFAAALAFMGREIVRTTRNTWLAVAAVAGCMIVPQIREYHASILSESLFLSLLVVFLGLSIRFAHYPTWRLMVLVAITVGASAVVRRTGFAFVPVMLVMVLLQRQRLPGSQAALFFVAALVPFGAIVGGEQVIAPLVHAGAPSSLMGRHLFAKAALIEAPELPSTFAKASADKPSDDPIRRALDDQLAYAFAPIRSMLASAPYNVRGVLTIYYETCLQGGCADEARALTLAPDEARQTELMGATGLARIRRAPVNFLKLTWLHYGSLWTVNRLRHPDTVPALNAVYRRAPADAVRALRVGARTGPNVGLRALAERAVCAVGDGGGRVAHGCARRRRPGGCCSWSASAAGTPRLERRSTRRARRTTTDGAARCRIHEVPTRALAGVGRGARLRRLGDHSQKIGR